MTQLSPGGEHQEEISPFPLRVKWNEIIESVPCGTNHWIVASWSNKSPSMSCGLSLTVCPPVWDVIWSHGALGCDVTKCSRPHRPGLRWTWFRNENNDASFGFNPGGGKNIDTGGRLESNQQRCMRHATNCYTCPIRSPPRICIHINIHSVVSRGGETMQKPRGRNAVMLRRGGEQLDAAATWNHVQTSQHHCSMLFNVMCFCRHWEGK